MKYSAKKLAQSLYQLNRDSDNKDIVDNFIAFCKSKQLDYLLPSIMKYYQEILEQNKNQKTIDIKSAFKISKDNLKTIKSLITQDKKIELNISEDKELLGGFIAQYKNKTYDASLKNQIQKLKYKLINNS